MARELAANPDSPASLRIMSAVAHATAPSQAAVVQVIDALVDEINGPTDTTRQAVTAAIAHWEKSTGQVMTPALRADFDREAHQLLERHRNRPPRIESIIQDAGTRSDIGYEMGLHLEGLRGTWHRLWGAIAFSFMFLATDDDELDLVAELRGQFESQLGRPMSDPEWALLVAHAKRHYETALRPKLGG
jgi:hypothetical protein